MAERRCRIVVYFCAALNQNGMKCGAQMSNVAGRIEQFCTGLILALVIALPPKCPAAEPLYSFGDIEIVRIPENSSYELKIWSKVPYPSEVGVQCHTSARGFFIYLDLNPGLGARIQNPQKFTTIL